MEQKDSNDKIRGWITPLFEKIVIEGSSISEYFLGNRLDYQIKKDCVTYAGDRAIKVDNYVILCLLVNLIIYFVLFLQNSQILYVGLLLIVPLLRIIDIVSAVIRITVFDRLKVKKGHKPLVASHPRIIVLSLINYVEMIICFASFYVYGRDYLRSETEFDWFTSIYFSVITQMTIGYGEISPTGWLRYVSCIQGLAGMLIIIFMVGRFISILEAEESLEEIHKSKS